MSAVQTEQLEELQVRIAREKEKLDKIKKEQARYVEGMRRVLEAQKDMLDGYETEIESKEKSEPDKEDIHQLYKAAPEPEVQVKAGTVDVSEEADESDTIADIVESVNKIADDADVRHYGSDGNETVEIDFDSAGENAQQIGMFDNDPTIKIPDIDAETAKPEKKEPKHKFNFTNLQFGKDYEIK